MFVVDHTSQCTFTSYSSQSTCPIWRWLAGIVLPGGRYVSEVSQPLRRVAILGCRCKGLGISTRRMCLVQASDYHRLRYISDGLSTASRSFADRLERQTKESSLPYMSPNKPSAPAFQRPLSIPPCSTHLSTDNDNGLINAQS